MFRSVHPVELKRIIFDSNHVDKNYYLKLLSIKS